jgi:transcriptional regulator of arginine metabolism
MVKSSRQKVIRDIISQKPIETQCQLTDELRHHGFNITQATISRDIKEMGLIKVAGGDGGFRYSLPPESISGNNLERAKRMLRDNLLRMEITHFIIVIRTLPGAAQGVAACIEGLGFAEFAGCIAGDDTIFMLAHENDDCHALMRKIQELAL